tara:strand:- start:36 stop:476 length:441 start_codon:yes stop_codon:yes gene_type:complete
MNKEEKLKAYQKQYYLDNKEKIKVQQKQYVLDNKEAKKQYRLDNKEHLKEYRKQWRLDNKEHLKEYELQRNQSQKDGYHRVYLLEDYNYVGVTNSITNRFNNHKLVHGRDCTNHRILYKTKDREDALELEELLHDIGYEGRNAIYK